MNSSKQVQLFLFPYSGVGGSFYESYSTVSHPSLSVHYLQYPGRDQYLNAVPINNIPDIAEWVISNYRDLFATQKPMIYFGHCLGALVAYHVCIRLKSLNGPPPLHFFASGCPAPHVHQVESPISDFKSLDFLKALQNMHHFQDIESTKSAANITLAALKSDFKAYESYILDKLVPLDCPITIFHGNDDRYVSTHNILAWRDLSNKKFQVYELDGHHLFIKLNFPRMMKTILELIIPENHPDPSI